MDESLSSMVKLCVDARQLICPEPIRLLHQYIRKVADYEIIELWATDLASVRDVHHFCQFLGHELLEQNEQNNIWQFKIRKNKPI